MSDEKRFSYIDYSGKPEDYEPRSEKKLARAKIKGFKKLFLCRRNDPDYDVVPKQSDYIAALAKEEKYCTPRDKNIIEVWKLNQKGCTDLILSIDHKTSYGKVAFRLVKNSKSKDYPEGNCKIAGDRLQAKYASKSFPSLLKHRKNFENSKLESVDEDPDEWFSKLEWLVVEIESIDANSAISDRDLIVKILNNLPSEYDVILCGLETRLKKTGDDTLTLDEVRENLGTRYERIKANQEEKESDEDDVAYTAFKKLMNQNGHKTGNGLGKNKGEFQRQCWYRHKWGHKAADCDELKKAMIAMSNADNEKMGKKCALALDKYLRYNKELGFKKLQK